MARTVDRQARVATILDAAMHVYSRVGYHSATIEDIAREARLGKGTLYLYFKSKEELTIRLVESIFQELENRQLARVARPATLDEFLRNLSESLDIPEEHAQFIRVFFDVFGPSFASEEFVASVSGFFDRMGQRFAVDIRALQDCDEIDHRYDAGVLARTLVSMIDGMVLHHGLFAISPLQHKKMVEQAICLIRYGLG